MSAEGQNIIQAVHQVRQFYVELANLLQTIDALMTDDGWASPIGSSALTESSASLARPDAWMPYYVYRFYTNAEHPTVLLSACAAIENPDPLLQEPLLIGQFFEFRTAGKDEWTPIKQSMANWHLWIPERVDNGAYGSPVDPRQTFPGEGCSADKLVTFGMPLVDFTDAAVLKDRFTRALLETVRRYKTPT